jgi:hypothetical protein
MSQITSHMPAYPMASIMRHRARPIARSAAFAGSGPVIARGERRCEGRERRAPAPRYEPYAAPSPCGPLFVAEGPRRRFVVSCKYCGRQLLSVDCIRDPEITVLVDHLRACVPSEPLGATPMLGDVMSRVQVAAAGKVAVEESEERGRNGTR